MKILTPSQLHKADQYTIEHQKISSWELMERASLAAVEKIKAILKAPKPVTVLAGSGNNGGDGLAIAFHLDQLGYEVEVLVLKYTTEYSKDCKINFDRLQAKTEIKVEEFTEDSNIESLNFKPVIIDAVFGIGLNRALPEFVEKVIKKANHAQALRIAIDVPSGLFLSKLTPPQSIIFEADYTLTFQCPKLNFFLPDYGNALGKIQVIDIGLDKNFINKLDSDFEFVNKKYVDGIYKARHRFSHKGDYGHLLVVGGQYGMMGSVTLTAKAALKSGVGKVTVLSPQCGVEILQHSVPEAMVIPSDDIEQVSPKHLNFKPTTICIGMGLGQSKQAIKTLTYFISLSKQPILIDADGLNILSKNKNLLEDLPDQSILTPHQGELKRLIGEWSDQYDKLDKMKKFSRQYNIILVSKDAYTFTVYDDQVYINSTGNSGLATAGSGDALAGIISSFSCQNYSPLESSILGVYIHGKAADFYTTSNSELSLTASDVINCLGKTL
ncbi:MAG: NAD(P)H-hydrate dehydratase [Bacteroidetes bacterium]|jgi:hydroxyethylthiazole kinase-like uncharacterized protein yjeF|nr:NAD(P)H-hydrate dehydratase [Bacteroidota bacterium]